jgi:hypothetical protein
MAKLKAAMGAPIAPAPASSEPADAAAPVAPAPAAAAAAAPAPSAADHVAKKPEIKLKPVTSTENGGLPETTKSSNKVYVNVN